MTKLILTWLAVLFLATSAHAEFFNLSPNMSLPVPEVGIEPGPQYATDINNSLTIIDAHNHTPGSGVQVPSAGLNINGDLTYGGNNITHLRACRMNSQNAPLSGASDLDEIYVSGVDLYYNDGNGNQVRITQSGGVAGSPGSISNLTSPATASYVAAQTKFVWQQAANTSADMDFGCALMRNDTASSNAMTICPHASLAADFAWTWPGTNPGSSNAFLVFDTSGNGSYVNVDGSTLSISSNTVKVATGGIGTTQIADGAVTPAKKAALGQQISSSSSTFTTSSGSYVDITNMTVTITTTGRPVFIGFMSEGGNSGNQSRIGNTSNVTQTKLLRGATNVAENQLGTGQFIPSILWFIDTPAAGTYVYKLQGATGGSGTLFFFYAIMVAYEL